MMIGCDAFLATAMALFALGALIAGPVPVWSLMLVAVLGGTAAGLRRPAAGVFPRLFATGDDLARAMATATLGQQLARIAGNPVGGVLLASGGLALTSTLDAGTFLVVLGVLVAVRPPHEPESRADPGESVIRQLSKPSAPPAVPLERPRRS